MKNPSLLLTGTLAFVTPILLQPVRLAGTQAPATTITVSGTVTRTGTSEPIPDVQVSLGTGARGFNVQSLQQLQETVNTAVSLGIAVPPALQAQLETQQAALRGGANAPIQLNATTDRAGRFVFQNVPAGQYTVRAEREGYFGALLTPVAAGTPPTFVQTNLTLAEGQAPPAISFSLTPGSAISGTVVDSEGRPVVAAQVQIYRVNYQNGNTVLQSVTNNSTTDDRGAYRLFRIPPGDYYLEVMPGGARGFAGSLAARGAAPAKQGLVRTFYPDALAAKDARMISLRGGEDMAGTAVAVRNSPLISVSGQVLSSVALPTRTGPRGNAVIQTVALLLVPHDKDTLESTNVRQTGNANMESPSNGQFQLTGITPGSYDLYARLTNANSPLAQTPNSPLTEPNYYFGRTSFEAGFNDVQGLTLTVGAGVELKAFATVDGSAAAAAGNVRLNLQSADSARFLPAYARNVNQVSGADGSIAIPFVNEGLFRLQAIINPGIAAAAAATAPGAAARGARGTAVQQLRDAYVEDIREGGVSVYDDGLVVGKQSPRPIEIIIKTNGGVIEGDVYDSKQQLRSGVAVVLVPAQARRQNPALYKTSTTNAMGHFIMRAVPPGQYKLFAWESVPNGAYQDLAFIAKFEERGRSVTVNASNTTNAQVTLINER